MPRFESVPAAIGKAIYTGYVNTAILGNSQLPDGWSVTDTGTTGKFVITHNLGLADGLKLRVTFSAIISALGSTDNNITYYPIDGNSFGVRPWTGGALDDTSEFFFTAINEEER